MDGDETGVNVVSPSRSPVATAGPSSLGSGLRSLSRYALIPRSSGPLRGVVIENE